MTSFPFYKDYMAEFYPAHFPENDNDDHRSGEEKVYRALKTSLRGPYKVFYSVKWLARQGEDDEARDGESDFVIVHPQHGILVMEVKGGGIRREGNRWVSIDSQRRKHWIKDPYEQAMVSKYALIKKIKSLPEWKDRWIDAGHAVVFPDCARPEHSLGLDAPGEITAFAEDLDEIERHVDSMYAYWKTERKNEDPLTNADVASICQLLAPSFELRRPLAAAVHEATREIITLTREQFRVLDYLSRTPRVIITGAAGTGKSTLALEKARRLSREGFETLLVCVSPALAAFFQRDFDGQSDHTSIYSLPELALSDNK
ncbi:MAG: NERD domain-containing protein, partial [Leptospiraceae bacterium]|nr:NERD domain-containing protein [Leptospiraceae bacterium]